MSNGDDVDVSDEQLNRVLQELDRRIGSIIEALPVNGLLVVFTCQGNTAEYRRLQARLPQIYMHTFALLKSMLHACVCKLITHLYCCVGKLHF